MLLTATPAYAINDAIASAPQVTIRFAPSPGSFPEGVSGIRTGIFGFRIDELPEPIPPAGYEFVGWFSDGVQLEAPLVAVRSTTVLAGFSPIMSDPALPSFAVVFNPGEGRLPVGARPIESFTYGTALTSLPIPVREGHYFAGWRLEGDRITAPYIVRRDMALDAVWYDIPLQQSPSPIQVPHNHLVAVFIPSPGVFECPEETGMHFGRFASTITAPPDPIRQGYIFKGWRLPTGETHEPPLTIRDNITLTAIWEQNPTASGTTPIPPTGSGSIGTTQNPPTNPINISLTLFIAITTLTLTAIAIHTTIKTQTRAKHSYKSYITRSIREVKLIINNRR